MRILRFLLCLCLALSLIGPAQARVVQAESDATLTAGLVMADLHNVISGQVDALGGEGAPAHVIAHGLVGCAVAELQGADCGAGAVGGMVSAFYAGGVDRNGGLDEEYAVFLGNRLWVTQVSRLYVEVIQNLLSEQPEAFHGTKLGDRLQLTSDPASLRQSVQVGEGYLVEANIDSTSKFERMKFILTELGLEGELFIKFA